MSKTMHAAVVERFGEPLVFRDVAIPAPGPGQVLVKTEVCGVCHTDLHAAWRLAVEARSSVHTGP